MNRRSFFPPGFAVVVTSGLFVAVGLTSASEKQSGTNFEAKPRESTVEKCAKWMSQLPDHVLLSQVSLPGTHDSCALYNGSSFGFAKCQSWQLEDQLKAGIRFLDIRCRHVADGFVITHGVIDQRTTFPEVRDVCRAFLKQHPTECIVMSVKEEATAKDHSRTFAETFADSTKNDSELWHISPKIPRLDSVRGRIVLVDRVGTLGGLPWKNMVLQDRYNVQPNVKARLIRSHFQAASNSRDPQWFINFCSGVVPGRLITPRTYASQSNEVALEYLRHLPDASRVKLGTIVMDFPGEELIERIIETNFAQRQANR